MKYWLIAWTIIGSISGAVFAVTLEGYSSRWVFTMIGIGAATGIVVAPIHRRVWAQLYPAYYLKLPSN